MSEEKKSRYTASQAKAAHKYLHEKVEDIRIRVPKGEKAVIQDAAAKAGESMNQFILTAIRDRMQK